MTIRKHVFLAVLLLAGSYAYAGDVSVNMPGISVKAQDNGGKANVQIPGVSVNAAQGNAAGKQAGRGDGGRIVGNDMSKATQCNGQACEHTGQWQPDYSQRCLSPGQLEW